MKKLEKRSKVPQMVSSFKFLDQPKITRKRNNNLFGWKTLYKILSLIFLFFWATINLEFQEESPDILTAASTLLPKQIKTDFYTNKGNKSNKNADKTTHEHGFNDQLYQPQNVYIAGIILDAKKINKRLWKMIAILNCKHKYGIHILVKYGLENVKAIKQELHRYGNSLGGAENGGLSELSCAPFIVHEEDEIEMSAMFESNYGSSSFTNRIDRISLMRDYHRSLLRSLFSGGTFVPEAEDEKNHENSTADNSNITRKTGVVVLVDLDLYQIPNAKKIVKQVKQLQRPSYPHDAICAAGITRAKRNQLWYFDTFATVILPDTFIHPLKRRLIPRLYHGEDPNYVRSDNIEGEVTQGDIMGYFQSRGKKSNSGVVSVKSCFGGMALYRASIYFTKFCQYQLNSTFVKLNRENQSSIMRYANSAEERPCEHVVFHDCLRTMTENFDIALNPELNTIWGRNMNKAEAQAS